MDTFIKEQQLKYPNREVKELRFGSAFIIHMKDMDRILNDEPIPKDEKKYIYKIIG